MKCSLIISKVHSNVCADKIVFQITDEESNIKFLEIPLTLEQFAKCITGAVLTDIECNVQQLENVGKRKIVEHRTILYPDRCYTNASLVEWLKENAQEEGWVIDPYLGSANSVHPCPEGVRLRYKVYKYIDLVTS